MTTASRSTYNHGSATLAEFDMEVHECGVCGVVFAMSQGFVRTRRNDHASWYCPNGHSWMFKAESREERLQRERDEARDKAARQHALRDQAEASLRATKGVVTKQRKQLGRVAKGVCPCCNRSFANLERHMATKHPEQALRLHSASHD